MYNKYYYIAGIIIKVESPFPFYVHNAVEFECEPQKPDYVFRFEQVGDLPGMMKDAAFVADLIWAHEYQKKDGKYLRAFLWKEFYGAVSRVGKKEGVCYYASEAILAERACEGFELLMYLCIEQILLGFGCLVLHSSHVDIRGKGIVFSAPSQTGKSTQAELWKKYAGARVLNGDRSILRKKMDQWFVYGCPMCGTSNLHLQGSEPLTNIVMLSQSTDNTVRRIHGMEAFRHIYPQITVPYWDMDYTDQVINLLNELLGEVPIWHYACTKEKKAVEVLRRTLDL